MKLRFWGVRGSIPAPGPTTAKYGGNTTSIEIRTDDRQLIILDAGTGIFPLAQTLLKELPIDCHIFISHSHWDHIQGLPFFTPLFISGNRVRIYGATDPVSQKDISNVLTQQMEYAFFPIREAELMAKIEYVSLQENQTIALGSTQVVNQLMNHPAINYGYKVICGDKSIFFTGDHEWPYNIYDHDDEAHQEYEAHMQERQQEMVNFFRGVDVLIIDTAYTEDEYVTKMGWGHGSFDKSIAIAHEAKVKHCFLTHHEPTRSDSTLEKVFHEALERYPRTVNSPQFYLAQEGFTFEF